MDLQTWVKTIGHREAARRIGVVESGLRHWRNKTRPVPAHRVIQLCRASDWAVTPHEVRPDAYPHPLDGLPEEIRREREHAA